MAYFNILSKLDRAIVAYIISQGAGTTDDTFPAKRSAEKAGPCTIVWSESSVEEPAYSGVHRVTVSVMRKTNIELDEGATEDQIRTDSDAAIAAVFDCLETHLDSAGDKLAEDITAAGRDLADSDPDNHADLADLTVQDVQVKGFESAFDEGGAAFVETMNLEVICCPSDVS